MPYDIVMPQLGMTMTEGAVTQWLKEAGQRVEKGEPLLIVETDKVDMEVESPRSGILSEILVELGKVVAVGTVVARIAQADETAENQETRIAPTAPVPATTQVTKSEPTVVAPSQHSGGGGLASPRAKRLAQELNVDISHVPDYAQKGRISEDDVKRFLNEQAAVSAAQTPRSNSTPDRTRKVETSPSVRKIIADRMTLSFQTVPHFYITALADASELVKLRQAMLTDPAKQAVNYTDFLIKALGLSLRSHTHVNACWHDPTGTVQLRKAVNVGLAVQAADRLVVPVVRNADKLSLHEVAQLRASLVERARAGSLDIDEVGDASCTLSNLGGHKIDHFQAIINPPESVMLAVGRIAPRAVVWDGAVVPRQTVYLSLSADHRVLDGSAGAAFLDSVVGLIETPNRLL